MAIRGLFAERPVQISKPPAFRAEYFPYSGPYPWLDGDDAFERIDDVLQSGEISLQEAEKCRYWSQRARKGDVLIRHANLIHGGSPPKNLGLSRYSIVCHYFVKGSFVYHDLASARSKSQYMGTCLLRDETGNLKGLRGLSRFNK